MKKYIQHTLILFIIALVVLSISCGGDDTPSEPTAQELALEQLSATWNLSGGSIRLDGLDVSANYPGFSLSYSANSYTTQNGGDLFSASGTWSWVGDSDRLIMLDDGKQINISTLNDADLVFSFQLSSSGGEAAGLPGSYEIALKK